LRNAALAGVGDRVALRDGDARQLPFDDQSFDIALSSWAIHNIYDAAGRRRALEETVRALRPGGRLLILDIRHALEYAEALRALGLGEVSASGPFFIFVIPSRLVLGRKGSRVVRTNISTI